MNNNTGFASRLWLLFARLLRRTLGRCVAFLLHDELERFRKKERANLARQLKRYQKRNEALDAAQKLVKIHTINKEKVASEMGVEKNKPGTTGTDEPGGVVLSLTSYPARMYDIHYTIHSLLSQTLKPERLVLWLGNEHFPDGEASVPQPVLDMKTRGLEIRFCKDLRPFTKLLPAISAFPGKAIVTADDDIFYPPDWLEKLVSAYRSDPKTIWCNRVLTIEETPEGELSPYRQWKIATTPFPPSFANFITGVGGVLYPPGSLHEEVFNMDALSETTPFNDDIWFWAMAVKAGTKIGITPNGFPGYLTYINPRREIGLSDDGTLSSSNVVDGKNDTQLGNVFARYPEVGERLKEAIIERSNSQEEA